MQKLYLWTTNRTKGHSRHTGETVYWCALEREGHPLDAIAHHYSYESAIASWESQLGHSLVDVPRQYGCPDPETYPCNSDLTVEDVDKRNQDLLTLLSDMGIEPIELDMSDPENVAKILSCYS
jgi:hypothetical protein